MKNKKYYKIIITLYNNEKIEFNGFKQSKKTAKKNLERIKDTISFIHILRANKESKTPFLNEKDIKKIYEFSEGCDYWPNLIYLLDDDNNSHPFNIDNIYSLCFIKKIKIKQIDFNENFEDSLNDSLKKIGWKFIDSESFYGKYERVL